MMNAEEAIVAYEDVAQITSQMLSAARDGLWDDLVVLEKRCASRVKTIAVNEAPAPLSRDLRERKLAVLRRILADDREIRDLTEPWMKQLDQLLHSTRTERKLSASYGDSAYGQL